MFKKSVLGLGALVACAWGTPALAGGAYCSPDWRPENPDLNCASQIAIAPGNDTRINLFLLVQDRAGQNGAGLSYPDLGWKSFYGNNFLRWQFVRDAWFPPIENTDLPVHYGSRCQTVKGGQALFSTVLGKATAVRSEQKDFLDASRGRVTEICDDGANALSPRHKGGFFISPTNYGSVTREPGAFLAYVEGAASFYAGDWDQASQIYSNLSTKGGDAWVKETALYMVARTKLNEAIEKGEDKWGYFESGAATTPVAAQAEAGFRDYLTAFPEGRYASSAQGLIRKSLWLQHDFAGLAPIYARLLNNADPANRNTAALIEEVDDKFLIPNDLDALQNVMLLAADDLKRMRMWSDMEEQPEGLISKAELDGQAATFANHPELYSFLKANHAFYVQGNYREVLKLVPDAARQGEYSPLAFSRQYLRGLALHALKDRNEAGFWLDLIKGSGGIWQRPAVELALARNYEQAGSLNKVFAKDSPIKDQRIRRILLGNSAGPKTLKAQSRDESQPVAERSFALFTGLLKQVQHGSYAGFLEDLPLAAQYKSDPDDGLWGLLDRDVSPVRFFTEGEWSDGYACPSLEKTVQSLARNAKNVGARLCLGDFYRLNGFDDFSFADQYVEPAKTASLGERNFYPGKATPRHDFYISIMSNRRASKNDRAYALYRAIRCYAPANTNTCGGPGVEEPQRAKWFRNLKQQYGNSKWAQELEYYW